MCVTTLYISIERGTESAVSIHLHDFHRRGVLLRGDGGPFLGPWVTGRAQAGHGRLLDCNIAQESKSDSVFLSCSAALCWRAAGSTFHEHLSVLVSRDRRDRDTSSMFVTLVVKSDSVFLSCSVALWYVCDPCRYDGYCSGLRSTVSKETYYSVKRDLLQCQTLVVMTVTLLVFTRDLQIEL